MIASNSFCCEINNAWRPNITQPVLPAVMNSLAGESHENSLEVC